jgi:7-carboxy-7-deazaguanine synthase
MDLKTPGSGEMEHNLYSNIEHLTAQDQVKFVICNEADYIWAQQQLKKWALSDRCEVLFSAAQGLLGGTQLADWVLRDRLPVRFQIQLHKYLWGDVAGR